MRRIIPYILAALAVLNLVWLFGFDYKIPSAFTHFTVRETQTTEEEEEVSVPEKEEEAQTQEPVEEAAKGEEAGQETLQQAGVQETAEEQAPAEQTAQAPDNGPPAAAETVPAEGERTCRPADGNTPNIRSGPGQDYGVIRMARFDEVMIIRGEEEGGWLPIRTLDGQEGYIYSGMLIIDDQAQ